MFFVIGLPSCFVLPCFGAGCHTFGLKIATAAMRPRNDTKIGTFLFENGRFSFMRLFFARCRPASSFKRFVPENVSFSRKTYQSCHCEEGAFLRPTRQSLTDRFAIPKRTIAKGSGSSPDPNIYYRTYKNRLLRVNCTSLVQKALFSLGVGRQEEGRALSASGSLLPIDSEVLRQKSRETPIKTEFHDFI